MDLRPYGTFTKRITAIEKEFIAGILRIYRDWRLEMLDLVDRGGLGPMVTAGLEAGIQELRLGTLAAVQQLAPVILGTAEAFTASQVSTLAKYAPAVAPQTVPTVANAAAITQDLETITTAWTGILRARMVAEIARLRLTGGDTDPVSRLLSVQITDGRASVWRIARNSMVNSAALGIWSAANGAAQDVYIQVQDQTGEKYKRQAIAAIDERTTDCCLRVHGQVVGMDQPFHLTGTPRFADYLMAAPFHDFCRTAETLYHPSMESFGITTDEMIESARDEIHARETTGTRVEIHPAHATSGR